MAVLYIIGDAVSLILNVCI